MSIIDRIASEWGSMYDARSFATNPAQARETLKGMDPPPAILLTQAQFIVLLQTMQPEPAPEVIPEGCAPVSHIGWFAGAPVYVEDT